MSLSTSTTPRTSIDLAKQPLSSSSSSILSSSTATSSTKKSSLWSSIKRHAKEHHESVNAAYATYYGIGQMKRGQGQEVWEYKRGEKA